MNYFYLCFLFYKIRFLTFCRAQSGKHIDALELLNKTITLEENELGARPERMVEIFALVCTIYDEVRTSFFVSFFVLHL